MSAIFARFVKDESGATAIEYGLIAALISVALITGARASPSGPASLNRLSDTAFAEELDSLSTVAIDQCQIGLQQDGLGGLGSGNGLLHNFSALGSHPLRNVEQGSRHTERLGWSRYPHCIWINGMRDECQQISSEVLK